MKLALDHRLRLRHTLELSDCQLRAWAERLAAAFDRSRNFTHPGDPKQRHYDSSYQLRRTESMNMMYVDRDGYKAT